ncbi:MAG: WD40 repeat domain-containing protein [Pyrinomonadaceae bacterium]
MKTLVIGIFLVALLVASATAQKDGGYSSYLAHIAAASANLQLDDTAQAKRWLAGAPSKYRNWEWKYLKAQTEQSGAPVFASESPVTAVATSSDGKWLAAAFANKDVRLFDAKSMSEIHRLTDTKLSPTSLSFSFDGKRLLIAYSGHTIKVFDPATGGESLTFKGDGRGITAAAFSPDGTTIASCSWVLDKETGVKGIVETRNAANGEKLADFGYGIKPLVSIAYSPDGKRLAVGSWEVQDTVAVWEAGKWSEPRVLRSEANDDYKAVQSIAISDDGKFLAAGGKDSAVRVWDLESGERVRTFGRANGGHSKWVNGIAFVPATHVVASASTDQTLRLFDVDEGTPNGVFHEHVKSVNSVAFSADGKFAFTGGGDGAIQKWDLASLDSSKDLVRTSDVAYGFDFHSDGGSYATAEWKGKISLRDSSNNRVIREWKGHEQSANAVAFSPDGKLLASVGNDRAINLFEASSGKLVREFAKGEGPQLVSVAFSTDGKHLISAVAKDVAIVWETATGKEVFRLPHPEGVNFVAASPDGKWFATGAGDGSVKLWNAKSGKETKTLNPHSVRVMFIDFSRDGRYMATASGDRLIKIFDLKSFKQTAVLKGHDELIYGIDFNSDGSRLASASSDQTMKLWDTKTGENVLSVPYEQQLYGVKFSPDGRKLAVLPMDGTIRFLKW